MLIHDVRVPARLWRKVPKVTAKKIGYKKHYAYNKDTGDWMGGGGTAYTAKKDAIRRWLEKELLENDSKNSL